MNYVASSRVRRVNPVSSTCFLTCFLLRRWTRFCRFCSLCITLKCKLVFNSTMTSLLPSLPYLKNMLLIDIAANYCPVSNLPLWVEAHWTLNTMSVGSSPFTWRSITCCHQYDLPTMPIILQEQLLSRWYLTSPFDNLEVDGWDDNEHSMSMIVICVTVHTHTMNTSDVNNVRHV